MRTYRQIAAFLLLVPGLFFIVPCELVHCCADHEDTVDRRHAADDTDCIDAMHTHCDILQDFISPYTAPAALLPSTLTFQYRLFTCGANVFSPVVFAASPGSRAPPACAC